MQAHTPAKRSRTRGSSTAVQRKTPPYPHGNHLPPPPAADPQAPALPSPLYDSRSTRRHRAPCGSEPTGEAGGRGWLTASPCMYKWLAAVTYGRATCSKATSQQPPISHGQGGGSWRLMRCCLLRTSPAAALACMHAALEYHKI